jgi:hypothetical protein
MILNLAVALGIGLLIGAERERRKGAGPSRSPAGIRTFTVTSLAGAVSFIVGGEVLLAVATAGVIILTVAAYWRGHENDPGLTTEIALILTALLGGLAIQQPALAAGIAVVVAVLLAARSRLHRFVSSVLTEDELNDGLIFAGATLVVLPLVPDRPMGPYGALNPHSIWILVILVMAISAAGYIAVRLLGARFGLPIAGLASGFISSTATIGAMGARVAKTPDVLTGDQHIIVRNTGPLDDPNFPSATVRIGYMTAGYADDHSIKVLATDFRTRITLIKGAIVFDSSSILCSASVSLAGIILTERRFQIQRQH